jgi:hypothetical protein
MLPGRFVSAKLSFDLQQVVQFCCFSRGFGRVHLDFAVAALALML